MRYIITWSLLLSSAISFAQSKADYEQTVRKFKKFYNAKQTDSIVGLWPPNERKNMGIMLSPKSLESLHEKNGDMISFQYVGKAESDPEKVTVFKAKFAKSTHAMSLTLDKNNYMATFRFHDTSSDEIKNMGAN